MSDELVRLFEQTSARGVLAFDEAGRVQSSHGAIEARAGEELSTVLEQLTEFGSTAGLGAAVEVVVQGAGRASVTRRREGNVFYHLQTERMTELTSALEVIRGDLSAKPASPATPAPRATDPTAQVPAVELDAVPPDEGASAVHRDRRPTERTPPPRGAMRPSSNEYENVTEEVDFRTLHKGTLLGVGEPEHPLSKKKKP